MSAHRNLGFVAAAATVLAAAPLSAIFLHWTWLIEVTIAVAAVAGAAALSRLVRAPLWGQVLAMLAGLVLALTWIFPGGTELLAFLPTPSTFRYFGELLGTSVQDMRAYGVKVDDVDSLLFLTVLGVGVVAVVADVLAVGLRRPALAGLPMLAIYSVPVAVYVDSVPATPFVVGACGYLWLLVTDNVDRVRRFGRRFTGEGRDVDVWEASPLAAAGRRLAVVGVAVAVALPLAVPGMTGGLLNPTGDGMGDGTGRPGQGGNSGRIDLFAALSGQLNRTEVTEFVKVTTNDPAPFYLRFGVADELVAGGFRDRAPSGRPVNRGLPDPSERAGRGVQQQRYHAKVEVTKNLNMALLPVYAEPVKTEDLGGNWLYDPKLQVIFSNRETSRGKRYAFDYVRSTYSPSVLRAAPSLPADDPVLRQQTVTPSVPAVDQLVQRLVKGKQNDYDKVRAIYDHFSVENGFTYSLTTRVGTSGDDISNFLATKAGFCQQYAAAMAWLVRAAGIPARVAFGFTNGTNSGGGSYVLTNKNLHAWTEVYFGGIGWVPFDPTPAASVPGSVRSAWAPDTDAPEEVAPSAGTSAAPGGGDSAAGPNRPDRLDRDIDQGLSIAGGGSTRRSPVWPWWAGGLVALLALLAVPALRRSVLRRRRRAWAPTPAATALATVPGQRGEVRDIVVGVDADRARTDAHAAWDELLDTLVDFQVLVDRTETPRATAERLVRETLTEHAGAVTGVRLLGRAEERARYARDPLTGEALQPALRAVRGALAARADRRTRIMAALLPPSVLLRWRTALAERSARLVAGGGRLRQRLLRWNPRRLLAGRPAR
ncbi:Transglutaminase-like superfamily protein [Micromonospora viridifaciens]|uniref:Transglutaminase-like superfamily protein n=1 Tax=Micromonospora viridifaciens TaxID=1881 RepID=A0A1C4W2A0_MICVI|nr:Transglutaminase-like superfamily protein [Micromonospora viridifaciens]